MTIQIKYTFLFSGKSTQTGTYWIEIHFNNGTNWNDLSEEKKILNNLVAKIGYSSCLDDPSDTHEISLITKNNLNVGTITCDFLLECAYIEFQNESDYNFTMKSFIDLQN